VTEWQSAEDRNSREKIDRARQAAEQLFKPAQRTAGADLPVSAQNGPNGPVSSEQPPRRQPRIFVTAPRVPMNAPVQSAVKAAPIARKTVTRRARTVPPAQIGRVRALATYGMTPAQVAELYGVTVGEIERIIRGTPGYSGKSR
jgi:hypothetical protein